MGKRGPQTPKVLHPQSQRYAQGAEEHGLQGSISECGQQGNGDGRLLVGPGLTSCTSRF